MLNKVHNYWQFRSQIMDYICSACTLYMGLDQDLCNFIVIIS